MTAPSPVASFRISTTPVSSPVATILSVRADAEVVDGPRGFPFAHNLAGGGLPNPAPDLQSLRCVSGGAAIKLPSGEKTILAAEPWTLGDRADDLPRGRAPDPDLVGRSTSPQAKPAAIGTERHATGIGFGQTPVDSARRKAPDDDVFPDGRHWSSRISSSRAERHFARVALEDRNPPRGFPLGTLPQSHPLAHRWSPASGGRRARRQNSCRRS